MYSTYLGGDGFEQCNGIVLDSSGNAYVPGSTTSSEALGTVPYPTTPGAYDTSYNSGTPAGDAFVTKLNESGTALVYSTYLGGFLGDYGEGIALDSLGNAYVTGVTGSDDFPTTGAFDTTYNGHNSDAFVTKLNASGTALVYSTYLGGAGPDEGTSLAVDVSGDAYVTGWTSSTNFPITPGAFDPNNTGVNPADAFVTKLNESGTALVYSTFLGGASAECGFIFNSTGCHIAVDSLGNAYVTGPTQSSDFPVTAGAEDTTHNGATDAFLTQLNATGAALAYLTFLGSTGDDIGTGIALDTLGNVYLTGSTSQAFSAPFFPTTAGSYDTSFNGSSDAFVAKIAPSQKQKVVLLLHGMSSGAETWNDFVKEFFNMSCSQIIGGALRSPPVPNQHGTLCYAINFGQFDKDGPAGLEGIRANGPSSGDFTSFRKLGIEVRQAVTSIRRQLLKNGLQAKIILVGHSRGGLAARSFLQDQDPNISKARNSIVGLITTGTPHVGSPLAKIYDYLDDHPRPNPPPPDSILPGLNRNWNVVDFLRGQIVCGPFPSIDTPFKINAENQLDVRRPTIKYLIPGSAQITQLILGGQHLPNIKYGQIRYTNVDLGILDRPVENGLLIEYSVFNRPQVGLLDNLCYKLSQKAERFILGKNKTPVDYTGDGIVPVSSQRYGAASFKTTVVDGTVLHIDEPKQSIDIERMFCKMGFYKWLTSCSTP